MFYLNGNFNFNSKHNEFGFVCHLAIIMEMDIDRSPSSEYPPWSLSRVTGPTLDPRKHWYVLTKSLYGLRPKEFAASKIFCHYQDEIQSVASKEVVTSTDSRPICTSYLRLVFVLDYFDSKSLLRIASYVLRNLPLLWTR